MGKGYLLILVGAIFCARLYLPILPDQVMFFWETRLPFWGFIFVSLGMRHVQGTDKELKYAQFFTMVALLLRLGLPWLPGLGFPNALLLALSLLSVFSPLAIFFWFFKSEYLWSPSSRSRMDLYVYSAIAFIYLLLNLVIMLPIMQGFIPLHVVQLHQARQFFNLLYNIVLVGLLVKLYLAAKNDTGLNRWI